MRRWLLICLILLLPAQFTWAAATAFCGHGGDAAAEQVVHGGDDADAGHAAPGAADHDAAASASPDCADLDCSQCNGHCHGHGAGLLLRSDALPAKPDNAAPAAEMPTPARVHASTRPERPQWPTLA